MAASSPSSDSYDELWGEMYEYIIFAGSSLLSC